MKFVNTFFKQKYRFRALSYLKENNFNMVFLPGGPGLGSETFLPWLKNRIINDTNLWLLDFPGDGSNHTENVSYDNWNNDLVSALSSLNNIILVTHSFSGMLVLTVNLEKIIKGLIIIGSSPNNTWLKDLPKRVNENNLPDVSNVKNIYLKNKSNENFKKFTCYCWNYFMNKSSEKEAVKLFSELPYNYLPYDWAENNFHENFNATWIPDKIPVIIITGENDVLTPIEIFKSDARFLKNNIAFLTIKNASHFPWVEQPEEMIEAITNFKDKF